MIHLYSHISLYAENVMEMLLYSVDVVWNAPRWTGGRRAVVDLNNIIKSLLEPRDVMQIIK